jgi:hypothetical protein
LASGDEGVGEKKGYDVAKVEWKRGIDDHFPPEGTGAVADESEDWVE